MLDQQLDPAPTDAPFLAGQLQQTEQLQHPLLPEDAFIPSTKEPPALLGASKHPHIQQLPQLAAGTPLLVAP
jgi:hypothetical protein